MKEGDVPVKNDLIEEKEDKDKAEKVEVEESNVVVSELLKGDEERMMMVIDTD